MAGQRCRLAANTLHNVAISTEGIDVVVEDLKARAVEMRGPPAARNRHTDTVSYALPERAGGGFNSPGNAVFGVAGSLAIQLSKPLNVVQADGEFAGRFVLWVRTANPGQV